MNRYTKLRNTLIPWNSFRTKFHRQLRAAGPVACFDSELSECREPNIWQYSSNDGSTHVKASNLAVFQIAILALHRSNS